MGLVGLVDSASWENLIGLCYGCVEVVLRKASRGGKLCIVEETKLLSIAVIVL